MIGRHQYVVASCCAFGAKRFPGRQFAVPADDSGRPTERGVLPPDAAVEPLDYQPEVNLVLCCHEATHAAVATLFGGHVNEVVVGAVNETRIDWSRSPPGTRGRTMMVLLSGWHAGNKSGRSRYRLTDSEIIAYVAAARDGSGGQCDECRCGRIVAPLDDDDCIVVWRSVEGAVLDLLDRPGVWRAIRRIADRLLVDHRIDGDAVRRIVSEQIDLSTFEPPSWKELEHA